MARITEDVRLPSNGKIYDTEVVTISNMTTAEEKMIYSSSSENAVNRVIQGCIQSDVDVNDLVVDDKLFLMTRLRMLTYGPKYPIRLRCNSCGNEFDHVVNLNELEVQELDDDFELPKFELPISKDELELRFLTGKDLDDLDKSIMDRVKKFDNQDEGEVAYIYSLAYLVGSVNGEVIPTEQLFSYINNLHARDSAKLRKESNKLVLGYPNRLSTECPRCRNEVVFRLPNTADFFLAEYIE